MANKIKFPELSAHDLSRVMVDWKQVPVDKEALLNIGRFVAVWDSDNPEDAYPVILPLHAITLKRHLEVTYTVLGERGYEMTYKHAAWVDESLLPCVVAKRDADYQPFVGRLIGCYLDENCDWVCAVKLNGSASVYFPKAADITFVKDVNFGIVEEENGNT